MRKMGWRDGQGVGPRVTFSQRKKQAFELGVKLGEMDGEDDGEGEASKHYFAPLDRPLASLESVGVASDRGWGLGYKAGPTLARATAMTSNGRGKLGVDLDDPYGDDAGPGEDERRAYRVMEIGDEDDDDYRMSGTGSHRQQAKVSAPFRDFSVESSLTRFSSRLRVAQDQVNHFTMEIEYCPASLWRINLQSWHLREQRFSYARPSIAKLT